MAGINIDVEGLGAVRDALSGKASEIRTQLEGAVAEAVESVQSEARGQVPVETGALHDAITFTADGLEGEVGVFDVDYGHFVEFGTSKQPAQPFMGPAAEMERTRFERRVRDAVD